MYACLHAITPDSAGDALLALAQKFAPAVEQTSDDTVVFSIAPLRKLMGSPHQIASEICRFGFERKLQASLSIAPNPDTAILLARNCIGVTMAAPGEERNKLGPLPCTCLFGHGLAVDPALAQVLLSWGVKTCEELAALPKKGVQERLGKAGLYLLDLACGRTHRPLRLPPPEPVFEESMQLEHALSLLEPLLFLFARALNEMCARLRAHSKAARSLKVRLTLEGRKEYRCELEFPVPLQNHQSILKLLQLHLEHHSPDAPITAFALHITPAQPRRVQNDFFLPPTPQPDKLQITLARIAGMVGPGNVGTPLLTDTHRPDAFEMVEVNTGPPVDSPVHSSAIRLAMRLFRPALRARVTLAGSAPKHVAATGVKGKVLEWAGPWKTSGEWWTATGWTREEWDVALDDGALYRIYEQPTDREWFVHGVYD
jgi:protein ImuB